MKAVSRDMCRLAWATSICLNSISIACEVDREVAGSQPGWRAPDPLLLAQAQARRFLNHHKKHPLPQEPLH